MDLLTASLQRFYQEAQRRYPDVLYFGDDRRQTIALTFDDGPHLRDTPRLLEVLEKHQVRATFFLLGKSAERHPGLVQKIHRGGHQLGLHGYRHVPFAVEAPANLRMQLEQARQAIADPAGITPARIRDLRPPYGIFTRRNLAWLKEWQYRLVMWNCIPPHWLQPIGWSIHQILQTAIPGTVIVLHDGHGHGTRVAEIVDAVVPRIKSFGLDFVTVDEMQPWAQISTAGQLKID